MKRFTTHHLNVASIPDTDTSPTWMNVVASGSHTSETFSTMKNMCGQSAHEVPTRPPNQPEISTPCFTAKVSTAASYPGAALMRACMRQLHQSMLKSPSASLSTKSSWNNLPHAAFSTSYKNTSILWVFYKGTTAKPPWLLLSSRLQWVLLL